MDWQKPMSDDEKLALIETQIGPEIVPRYLIYDLGPEITELTHAERCEIAPHFFPGNDRCGGALVVEKTPESPRYHLRVERARAMPMTIIIRGTHRPLVYVMHIFYEDGSERIKKTPSVDFRKKPTHPELTRSSPEDTVNHPSPT